MEFAYRQRRAHLMHLTLSCRTQSVAAGAFGQAAVVIPLSQIGTRPTPPAAIWVTGVLVHMFLIGVPIALAARQGFAESPGSAAATRTSMSRYSRQ